MRYMFMILLFAFAPIGSSVADDLAKNLIFAVAKGDLEQSKKFMDSGADPNWRDYQGWNTLFYAASGGYSDILKYLIENGASVNFIDNKGQSPIDSTQNVDIIKVLKGSGGKTGKEAIKNISNEIENINNEIKDYSRKVKALRTRLDKLIKTLPVSEKKILMDKISKNSMPNIPSKWLRQDNNKMSDVILEMQKLVQEKSNKYYYVSTEAVYSKIESGTKYKIIANFETEGPMVLVEVILQKFLQGNVTLSSMKEISASP